MCDLFLQNIVLNSLQDQISRIVYDSTVKYHDIDLFLQTLQERQKGRKGCVTAHIPSALLIPNSSKQNTAFKNVNNFTIMILRKFVLGHSKFLHFCFL